MESDAGLQQPRDPSVAPSLHSALGQTVCVALRPPPLRSPPLPAVPRFSLCKVDGILLGLHEPLSGEYQEWNSAAPAQTGGVLHSQAVRQTDRQLQQYRKLPFQLQGAYVSPTRGPSGSPCQS